MELTNQYLQALEYAFHAHNGQFRKGTHTPYFSHLAAVSSLVMKFGGTETEAIAALLHDAAEDQGGEERLNDIRAKFGKVVSDIVADCSDTFEDPKPAWEIRKRRYLEHLRSVPDPVRLVSACDKLHNIRSIVADYLQIGDEVFERFKASKERTLWYYEQLGNEYMENGPTRIGAELLREVERLRE